MMKKEITCIICPRGCALEVEIDGDAVSVSGNSCPKGNTYGIEEATAPRRTVTSIVRVSNRKDTMVSVKTSPAVPKEKMADVMAVIRSAEVNAPVRIGDVLLKDVFGSDIIATKDID